VGKKYFTVSEVHFSDQWRMSAEMPLLWVRLEKRRMYGVAGVLVLLFGSGLIGLITRNNFFVPFEDKGALFFVDLVYWLTWSGVLFYIAFVAVLMPALHLVGRVGGFALILAAVCILGYQIYMYLRVPKLPAPDTHSSFFRCLLGINIIG
jgi:hypothetical protein